MHEPLVARVSENWRAASRAIDEDVCGRGAVQEAELSPRGGAPWHNAPSASPYACSSPGRARLIERLPAFEEAVSLRANSMSASLLSRHGAKGVERRVEKPADYVGGVA